MTRRQALGRSAAWAALVLAEARRPWTALGGSDEKLIPFLDVQPKGRPMLQWQNLTSWATDTADLFSVSHYGPPKLDPAAWRLEIAGLVERPKTFSLEQIRARHRRTLYATLECSGNGANPGFMGAIGNPSWTGAPLAPLLRDCGLCDRAIELVFFGADQKTEKIRDMDLPQNFGRSLSRGHALRPEILLAYEMNGRPLPFEHGGPVRLVVPGWFGIAWVKWLSRIEALDRRFMGRFMARDYVTIRGEEADGRTIWRETSVGPIDVKSIIARALRQPNGSVRLRGAAWTDGTPLRRVEVKIDDGPWRAAELERKPDAPYSWTFFQYDWKDARPGDHTVVSRAVDRAGRVQPARNDPAIALKKTYWEANQQWPRRIRL